MTRLAHGHDGETALWLTIANCEYNYGGKREFSLPPELTLSHPAAPYCIAPEERAYCDTHVRTLVQ